MQVLLYKEDIFTFKYWQSWFGSLKVTFIVGAEHEEVHAHKFVLISHSPVFHAMFEGPLAEKGKVEFVCAVPYITEISLIVTLNNQFTSPTWPHCTAMRRHIYYWNIVECEFEFICVLRHMQRYS